MPRRPPPTAVLWDLDGTLLHAKGAGARCFREALAELGRAWPDGPHDFGGRTDRDIATTLLATTDPDGRADGDAVASLLARVVWHYHRLAAELDGATRALPHALETIAALQGRAVQTVVTGNLREIAHRKVAAIGAAAHVRVDLGAYGDDHTDRHHLVASATQRIAAAGLAVDAERCWVVGDTPRDLAAARTAGVRCALVATGTFPYDDLRSLDADVVVADLTDPQLLAAVLGAA